MTVYETDGCASLPDSFTPKECRHFLLQPAHPLPWSMLHGSQTTFSGSKTGHCQAPHACRNGSGGSANRGLEVLFPTLLRCLARPGPGSSFCGHAHNPSLSQSVPALEPSGLFRVSLQACALLRGDVVSLLHFLRTSLPHIFSPAGGGCPPAFF